MHTIQIGTHSRGTFLLTGMTLAAGWFSADARADETYAVDFVSTAAAGEALNDAGDVAGNAFVDAGCGPWCVAHTETAVWVDGERLVLPGLLGYNGLFVTGMNSQGWISGFAGSPTAQRALVWVPTILGYKVFDLGVLPGTQSSITTGIDDFGRVVGSSTGGVGGASVPFLWTEADGMVDLTTLGFPPEIPLAISPAGVVATAGFWYSLDNVGSVARMAPPPQGFDVGTLPTAINDSGEQARFLFGDQDAVFLFRYHADGTWVQLALTGTDRLGRFGIGSINSAGDVSGTIGGMALVAYGPDGRAEALSALLSPAYAEPTIPVAAAMNDQGDILAQVAIGHRGRLVKLTPVAPCGLHCLQVSEFTIQSDFVPDPQDPEHCTENGAAYNATQVDMRVTGERGFPIRNVSVTGRFLDAYLTDEVVTRPTNARGQVQFSYIGRCGVGEVAFLVEDANRPGWVFDRSVGTLTGSVLPQ